MSFDPKADDSIFWRRHILRTDLRYQTEKGNAFSASDRWDMPSGSVEYLEFRIPVGVTVRIYDRLTAVEANDFNFDLCSVDSITPGGIEFSHTNMRVGRALPQARIWRGATSPVNLVVREKTLFPNAGGFLGSGSISESESYRIIDGSDKPSILRVENTGGSAAVFNIIVLWTEEVEA